jgi:hypothetical protein
MKITVKNWALVLFCGTASIILIAGAAALAISRPANATPAFAAQTGRLVVNAT